MESYINLMVYEFLENLGVCDLQWVEKGLCPDCKNKVVLEVQVIDYGDVIMEFDRKQDTWIRFDEDNEHTPNELVCTTCNVKFYLDWANTEVTPQVIKIYDKSVLEQARNKMEEKLKIVESAISSMNEGEEIDEYDLRTPINPEDFE